MQIQRFHTGTRMSQAVVYNNMVFLAGQVARDTTGDVAQQTAQVLEKIQTLLAEVGSDKTKILSATIWLADMKAFQEMNPVWDAWVAAGAAPARACVEAKLATPDYLVEIGIIAAA